MQITEGDSVSDLLRDAHPCMFGLLAAITSPSKLVYEHTLPQQKPGRKRNKHTEAEWSAEKVSTIKRLSESGIYSEEVNIELQHQPFTCLIL